MAIRSLIVLMVCAAASAQSPDDYNVFVRALPPQQAPQQVYAPQPQQPYQQVRGPSQFQYQDTYPSQYYQDYHQPAPPVQQQRHLPQHPAPSSASSSQEEVDDFPYQQAYEPPTTSTTTSTTSTTTTTTTTTTEPPPPLPAAPSTEAPRPAEVQKSQMSVSSSVENSDRQGKAQQAGGQKPVQVVQKTVTKDKDGKKEEYVVYYYYYYDDDKKNETAKEQPVDSLDSFDSDSKSKFQPRTPSSTTASPSTAGAAVPKEAISISTTSPVRSPPATSVSTSVSSGASGADQIAALTGARLIPETGSQPQSLSSTPTTSTSTTTTSTTTSTSTTETPSTSTATSDDKRKGFGNRRNKPQRQSGETGRRRTSTTSTTTEAPSRKPLASRKPRPTRPSRLNRRPKPSTEAPKESDENKEEQKETATTAPDGDKPGRKRFGGGPRPRGPKRTTAAPTEGDDTNAATTIAPRKPLPTRGTAGGLFGKGQGIRGPRPKPGRRPIKKEETAASEAPADDKEKPAEAPKTEEPAVKPETKAEETPSEGSSDASTAAPARARQRQRGALFAGGRPRPNLKRPTTAATTDTEN